MTNEEMRSALRQAMAVYDRLVAEGIAHGMSREAAIQRANRTMGQSLAVAS